MTALFPQSQFPQEYIHSLEASIAELQASQTACLQSEQILKSQIQALIQLSQSDALSKGDLQRALQEITETTAQILQVERVSIWRFDPSRTKIHCLDLFEQIQGQHSQGIELQVADYPRYFTAIGSEPLIVACDAQTHPCTREFKNNYLIPLNIQSMLDSGFQLDQQVGGVICCEQVGIRREWSQADQNFVRSVAHLISLVVESHRRQQQAVELQQAISELQQAQLQIVQQEKMSALGNLMAGVAHEINNPVSCLSANIIPAARYVQDLLHIIDLYQAKHRDSDLSEAVAEIDLEFIRADFPKLIESMGEATTRIQAISQSLRTFSRSDHDRKQLFNVHDGLDSTLMILKHRLQANSQRPEIAVIKQYGDIPPVMCFPGQLNQVFMNLFANAIDAVEEANQERVAEALPTNPNRITIATERWESGIRIRIADNGIGMPESVQQRIFDHLFTTKGVGKGTGLGLAIAQQIVVEKHQGKLSVQSALQQGTEFILELPL